MDGLRINFLLTSAAWPRAEQIQQRFTGPYIAGKRSFIFLKDAGQGRALLKPGFQR